MVLGTSQDSALCLACGLCCNGVLHSYVTIAAKEIERLKRQGLVIDITDDESYALRLPCPSYKDGKCSIYARRPSGCRTYKCELLKGHLQGKISLEEAKALAGRAKNLIALVQAHLDIDPSKTLWQTASGASALVAGTPSTPEVHRANAELMLDLASLSALLRRYFIRQVLQGKSASAYLHESLQNPQDINSTLKFLLTPNPRVTFFQRLHIVRQLYIISASVECPHLQYEVLSFIQAILDLPQHIEGCAVEAGCYKGGSTAKFSIAAKLTNRRLVVFDSFEGLPQHNEPFPARGSFCGTLDEVRRNVGKLGKIEACEFVKGWFNDTMPGFTRPIVAIFLDVDLASSTRVCLKHLYPLLVPGGVLYSHDGHLPVVLQTFDDGIFWEKEVGYPKPHIERLGRRVIRMVKQPLTKYSSEASH